MRPFIVFLVLFLGGCGDAETLKQQNVELKAALRWAQSELAFKEAERAAELVSIDRQVSIAAACDWLIPLCPRSITDAGHNAMEQGYGGGGFWFWFIVIVKSILLAAPCGATVAGFTWVSLRAVRPEANSLREANRIVANAQQLATADAQLSEVRRTLVQAEIRLSELNGEIDRTVRFLATATQELAAIERRLAEDAAEQDEVNAALFAAFRKNK